MEIVRRLARCIELAAPNHLLLVRPYPISQGVNLRPLLKDLKNIRWDDDFRSGQIGRSLTSNNISERLNYQRGAKAFFHIGTTMGFEGAFLGIPNILIQPPDCDNQEFSQFNLLQQFSNQYHLIKHLVGPVVTLKITDDLKAE
jgi:hypothetical protein